MAEPLKDGSSSSMMAGALRSLTRACIRRPIITLMITALSVVACLAYTAKELRFKTDRADLIDPSTSFHQRWLKYKQSFGESSDMVVVVEADEPETIKHALDHLGERLAKYPDLFANVLYKIEPGKLRDKGLQYLPPEVLVEGLERIEEYRAVLNGDWELMRLERMAPLLRFQLQDATRNSAAGLPDLLTHADRLTESLARFSADRNDFTNPWPDILPVDPQMREQANQTVYMLNETGTMGFLMAAPAGKVDQYEGASLAIDRLRQLLSETQSEIPNTKISLTGIPVLENDEMRLSQKDSTWASMISFIGVSILFFFGLRGFVHPLLGMIVLAVGMAWSFGFTTLVVGHLNILSIAFASIVIGLGNDFAIHILSRYLDLRHHNRDVRHALTETAESIGPGIITGAVTTGLAFFCASFTSFLGIAELGIIAGGGILLCTLATFTCLPALIAMADRHRAERMLPVPFQGRWLRMATNQYPGTVLALSICLFAGVAYGACDWSKGWPRPRLHYDHNLLNLQAEGLESVEAQRRVFESSNNSLLYAISLADSAEEARERKAQLEALPTVRHVEDLASRLPQHPPAESKLLVQGFHALLDRLPEQPPPPTPVSPGDAGRILDDFYEDFRQRTDPAGQRIARHLDQFLDRLDKLETREQVELLTEFQYRLAYSLLAQFQALYAASDPDPVSVDDLPPELRARYVSPHGQWLLQVFPKHQIWDMEPLAAFVKDLRSVDPEITGTPLQNFEAALQIKESYEICSIYSLVVILLVLLIDFLKKDLVVRSFVPPAIAAAAFIGFFVTQKQAVPVMPLILGYTAGVFALAVCWDRQGVLDTISAIVPPFLGLLLTFGLLAVFDVSLNPANLIILPLIIGIGVDNGVHVLHDFHSKPHEVYSPSASMVNAITMTSSTSIVGFGSMMISSHRGLYSLGLVLSIGVASCVLLALVTLPAFLAWLSRHRRHSNDQASVEDDRLIGRTVDAAAEILPLTAPGRVA